ncbi:MAG TPA: hypothetical protein VF278_03500 [Pirellulales bacterium]
MFSPASGEIWRVRIDDGPRRVRVLAAAGLSGWWRCVDLATDVYVLVPENCLVEAERAATSPIVLRQPNGATPLHVGCVIRHARRDKPVERGC